MKLLPYLAKVKPVNATMPFECGDCSTPYVVIKILVYESRAVQVKHRCMPRYDEYETNQNAEPELSCFESFIHLAVSYECESNRCWCKQARKTLHHKSQGAGNRNHVPPATVAIPHT